MDEARSGNTPADAAVGQTPTVRILDAPGIRIVPGWHLHRRIYDWMLSYAHRPSAPWALFWFSFAEASFFPVPPDVLMVPMCLERRERTWWFVFLATLGSVLGGLGGYGIGVLAQRIEWIHKVMVWAFTQRGVEGAEQHLSSLWVVTLATIIFHPYKLLTIAAGYLNSNVWVFITGSIIGRAVRFIAVGALVYWFGPAVKSRIDRSFHALSIGLVVLIAAAFVFIRYHNRQGAP